MATSIPTLVSWSNGQTLTADDLNSNFNNIRTVVNADVAFKGATNTFSVLQTFSVGLTVTASGITVTAGGVTVNGGTITAAASVTGAASLNLPHGTAPSAPNNGDMWTTTGGLFVRINGATQTAVTGTGTSGKGVRWTGTATTGDASFTDDGTYLTHATQPRCYVRQSASPGSVTAGGNQIAAFSETDVIDVGAMHDPASNNTRITIPASAGGLYLLYGQVTGGAASTNGTVQMEFLKNGSTLHGTGVPTVFATGSETFGLSACMPVVLSAADYIELRITNNGSQTIGPRSELAVIRLW